MEEEHLVIMALFFFYNIDYHAFGQRLAKDYDGARTIAIYFIPSVLAVFWLS
jgi:hypothetical protein